MSGITVNGTPWEGPVGSSVSDLVAAWCPSPKGVAVARNGEVVPRSQWALTSIGNGDRVEIVAATAGG